MCDSSHIADRICLGTAQIGMDYGVANQRGRPDDAACTALLSCAVESNILRWDTARSYGDAELRIGRFLANCSTRHAIQIVSKIGDPPPCIGPGDLLDWVTAEVTESLQTLRVERLADLLIHSAATVRRFGQAIWDALMAQVECGRVERVGLSVYDQDELQLALDFPGTAAVQLPVNLLDHRLSESRLLRQAVDRDISVYARSSLLQGVFAMSISQLPKRLHHLVTPLTRLQGILGKYKVGCLDVALPFVLAQEQIDYVVVGVDEVSQLKDCLTRANQPLPIGLTEELRTTFRNLPTEVLEPRNW